MIVHSAGGKPIKIWVDNMNDIEESARLQLETTSRQPYIFRHLAVMPDCHMGVGVTIGSVMASKYGIVCSAVGVDIGCGVKTATLQNISLGELKPLFKDIRELITSEVPVGTGGKTEWSKYIRGEDLIDKAEEHIEKFDNLEFPSLTRESTKKISEHINVQLGTLGGGNHFIDFLIDEEKRIWIAIHSGSRNVGNRIGNYYIKLAKDIGERHFSNFDKGLELLPKNSDALNMYIMHMNWAIQYARLNREVMMRTVLNILKEEFNIDSMGGLDVRHNYAGLENHFGENIWVHRKGAISAKPGEFGIIPGSMGTNTYVVEGLGNRESYNSASHGAGRTMSRSQAKKTIKMEDFEHTMGDIDYSHSKNLLDESPQAYKNIDNILRMQSDLVKITHTLRPIMVIQGEK